MKVKHNNKHDIAVKAMFDLGTNAPDFFVAAMPAQLRDMLDIEQLQPLSEALHSGNGNGTRELRVDLLYGVPARTPAAAAARVVLEHKSRADRRNIWQLQRYVCGVMARYELCGEVIVVVLYHGREPWKDACAGRAIPKWVSDYAAYGKPIRYILVDLSRGDLAEGSPETAHISIGLRTLLETLRVGHTLSSEERLRAHVERYYVPLYAADREQYEVMVNYLLDIVRLPLEVAERIVVECIEKGIADDENRREGPMKTVADQLRDQGRVDGERRGIEKERTEVAQRLLAKDFDSAVVREVTGLSASTIEELRHSLNGS